MKRRSINKEKRQHVRQKLVTQVIHKKKTPPLCPEEDTCAYISTCPTYMNKICNATVKCCKKCIDTHVCPMKGIK